MARIALIVLFALFLAVSMAAAAEPYPPSPVITDVTFDWSTHVRQCPGSDNWPVTWGDDNHQYVSWGDGGGFTGTNSNGRVSLGFARVQGAWNSYTGYNVWGGLNTENPAQFGGKSYGILCISGDLYAWWGPGSGGTSYTETRMLKSTNKGATWTKSSWDLKNTDANLIMPTICNFGKNYSGARDGYVYSYFIHKYSSGLTTHKGGSPATGKIYLARVPQANIQDITQYEWFSGTASSPAWSLSVSAKKPVFEDANGVGWCMNVSYNAGLKRYLLTTEHMASIKGNLGIFDAPEPWGPWTTVKYYSNWAGTGTTFFCNFSNKWTSADGKDTTMIFTGTGSHDSWNTIRAHFSTAGNLDPADHPASPVITDLTWGSDINLGTDNDNWPCTWAADGNLYAAGGDGIGFGPTRKSCWVTKISGDPWNGTPSGTNVSDLGSGSGASGLKGSGLLAVDGTIYMWVRNADLAGKKSLLKYSTNNAASWNDSFTFDEFGYCSFINFGQDYGGARDNYVYVVSHDNPSAYVAADSFVLMRVPKGSIRTESAYEYLVSVDTAGNPTWSGNINDRGSVFTNAGKLCRSGISYDAAIGRYLWWQQDASGGIDTRSNGTFGIYDAPEPWGPWTTVYEGTWSNPGPGDGGSFPTKWMRPVSSGKQDAYLVFSGNDHFMIRKATFTIAGQSNQNPTAVAAASPLSGDLPLNVNFDGSGSNDPDGSISAYAWNFGDGNTGSGVSPSHTYTAVGNYTAVLTVTDDGGATDTDSVGITVTAPVIPVPDPADALAAAAVSPTAIDLTWNDNSGDETGFRIERSSGTVSKSVVLKTYNSVNETPTIEAAGTVNSFKAGAKQAIDRSNTWTSVPAALDGATRLLTARDDKGDAGFNSLYVVTLSHAMTVYATISPEYGNTPMLFMDGTWSDTGLTASIDNAMVFNIWKKDAAAGDLILGADNDGSKQGATYIFPEAGGSGASWSTLTTVNANVTAHSDTGLSPETTYTYRVIAFNAQGDAAPSNEDSATTPAAAANQAPTAVAAASPANGMVPLVVSFDGSGSSDADGTVASYAWNFGDGQNGTGVNAGHTYTSTGSYTAVLTVTDDDGDTDTDSVTITITAVPNNAPVADNQNTTVPEDGSVVIILTAGDADGDPLTYAVAAAPQYGSLSGTAPNLTYTPLANYNGSDSFTFKANDGLADSNTAAVSITVTAVNDIPVADSQNVSTSQDVSLNIVLTASDLDGDPLSYAVAAAPAHGSLTGSAPALTYTPDSGWFGSDSFNFRANDGTADSNTAAVTIVVNEVSSALAVSNITRSGYRAEKLDVNDYYYIDRTYRIAAIPAEMEGLTWIMTANNDKYISTADYLSFDVNQAVTVYIAYDNRASSLPLFMDSYTDTGLAINTTSGSDSPFHLHAQDYPAGTITLGGNHQGGSTGANSNYLILIKGQGGTVPPPPNDPPVAVAGADAVTGIVPLTVDFTGSSSYDPDGSITAYSWDFGEGGTSTAVNPVYTFTQAGDFQVSLNVTDDDGETGSTALLISVSEDPGVSLEVIVQQPAAYAVSTAYVGSLPYVDRSYSITNLPVLMEGRKLLRTANSDKYKNASDHLIFNVNMAADVYVAYDRRASSLPVWMGDFADSGLTVSATDGAASPMPIYRKTFPAGTIVLGGNMEGGDTGARSNYYVFVLEQGTKAGPPAPPAAGTVIEDTWFNPGDSDGDGLPDTFENLLSLNQFNTDTDADTISDESELGADGRTLFETATGLTVPSAGNGAEGTKSGCMPGTGSAGGLLVLLVSLWTLRGLKRRDG